MCLDQNKINELPNNAMLKVKPELYYEWDFAKNDESGLNIWVLTYGSDKHVYWKCNSNHEWTSKVRDRVKGNGCPYCANNKVLKGFNDMWTTAPEQASWLLNPNDGYKYTKASSKSLDWKCPNCEETIKNRKVTDVNNVGLCCKICSDGIPITEKIIHSLLRSLNIDFVYDKSQTWSNNKRYDFYIPSLNCIIETHGSQHYNFSFSHLGGRTLEEESENDYIKRELAIQNGVKYYVVIDCRKSEFEYIKNNIFNSELSTLLDLNKINFENLFLNLSNSFMTDVWELWNSGIKSTKKISELIKLHQSTVTRYLKIGASINKVTFSKNESDKLRGKPLVQLEIGSGKLISDFSCSREAERITGINRKSIINACKGLYQHAGNYKWMYLSEYKDSLENCESMSFDIKKIERKTTKIIQLDLNGNYLREWDSIVEACKAYSIKSANLSAVCRGIRKSAKGYKWMYKRDYDKYTAV